MELSGNRPLNIPERATFHRTGVMAIVFTCFVVCRCSLASESDSQQASRVESSSHSGVVSDQPVADPKESTVSPRGRQQQPMVHTTASPLSGRELYVLHCAGCHGDQGDGKGLAAPYLFPKPRNFREGKFRLVSTSNNVPTREDLNAVLLRGMPGSAMPPWSHLTQEERNALVDEVLRMRREAARESYIQNLREDEELTAEEIAADDVQEEIEDYVRDFTTPGKTTKVPAFAPPTAEAISRGKEVYAKFACISCHGETGRGDGVQKMFDDEKLPTRPRDFTLGIFKGRPDPASLYRRIAFGMPGTPMPGSSTMTPEQMADLVHYIRSLSTEEARQSATMNREQILVKAVNTLPESIDSDIWADVAPVSLKVMPLWWRNDADPHLQVQAVHDGHTIALRISWEDDSPDEHATQSQSFRDAVAMELYRGEVEPFLGMGSLTQPVDVWFWDADRQTASDIEDQYPRIVDDVYPFSEKSVETAEYRRPGTSAAEQPKVSLPAVASKNQIVPTQTPSGGSDLGAGRPGSLTFRIPKSQLVSAFGQWNEGKWTVVMQRSLAVDSTTDGVALEPSGRTSVAFAIWNGSKGDRDGQKKVTIWQDLELEK